ncbi:MAG: HPr family phosphocarrier protein [Rickettsiales bacterium]|nr:HPr family phosphocarrier protein [Rickettsiales bacterium]
MESQVEGRHAILITIQNIKGLHARASTKFVKTVESCDARVMVTRTYNDNTSYSPERDGPVNGASMLALLMLAAEKGATLRIEAEGEGAAMCLEKLSELINSKFGEE